MARKRNKQNQGLPARWRLYHGAYFYQVPPGLESKWDGRKQFRLGKTLGEAAQAWAKRMAASERPVNYVHELLERYAIEVTPTKAVATQAGENASLANLRKVFGDMRLVDVEPQHIYKYADTRVSRAGKKSLSMARHDIGVFKHAFTKAVEWGLMAKHPFKGEVRLKGAKPRTRYVEDWEIVEALSLEPMRKSGSVRMIQAYIRIKMLIGLRRGDLLRLRMSRYHRHRHQGDASQDGRHNRHYPNVRMDPRAPGRRRYGEGRQAPAHCPVVVLYGQGEGYFDEETGRPHGWNSMWQRFMARLLKDTKIKERFTEHDLRAKCASDAESLGRAQQLLGHADSKITERVYRRKPETVRPLR